ncbi:MAG: aldehyde dehydrogenase family protein, partial [Spirochaetota bacterium]
MRSTPGADSSDGSLNERVSTVVQGARTAFASQSGAMHKRGYEALTKLESAVRAHENEFIEALRADFGKPELESVASELTVLYQEIRELRRRLKRFFRPSRKRVPFAFFRSSSRVLREPYGVVLVIAPWNYPLQLSLVPVAGAIAAGNSVVLKPSELAPNVAGLLESVLSQAFPDGLVSVVNGDRTVAEALLRNRFDHIFYTGNTTVGRIIMEAASVNVTPVTLELGGKSPAIVTSNADLRVAAQRVAWGKRF